MKVRTNFVTNSSSSCFIIAKKNNYTIREIENNIRMFKQDVIDSLKQCDLDYSDESVNLFISRLANNLYQTPQDLKLGDWIAFLIECDNESDQFDFFMYEYGYKLGTANFKVG